MLEPTKEKNSNRMHLFNTTVFNKAGELDWGKVFGKMFLLMVAFLIIYFIGFYFLKDSFHAIGDWVSHQLGYPGVAVFVFLNDLLIVPISVDILFPFVLDWEPVGLLLILSIASALGGYGGYWIGRLLGKIRFIKQFTDSFSDEGEKLIKRYGVWAVVIAGFTPIPFSTICWMTGMLKVDHWKVALATLSRFPRMIVYYYIFRGGLSFIS